MANFPGSVSSYQRKKDYAITFDQKYWKQWSQLIAIDCKNDEHKLKRTAQAHRNELKIYSK